jgi:hypothetical protein
MRKRLAVLASISRRSSPSEIRTFAAQAHTGVRSQSSTHIAPNMSSFLADSAAPAGQCKVPWRPRTGTILPLAMKSLMSWPSGEPDSRSRLSSSPACTPTTPSVITTNHPTAPRMHELVSIIIIPSVTTIDHPPPPCMHEL